ncbi:MAG TPA: dockerin type I domain-containing protein, partial [Fimbriimonadaceae bacterium]|nr:dockerin type I domain-containing protein [Fimbriimonadaceae bacterium]
YIQTNQPHPDCHAIVASPGYNGTTNRQVYFCTDGGSYMASDITAVNRSSDTGWNRLDMNTRTTQYYYVTGDGPTGHIMGGLQDNGTLTLQNGSNQAVWPFGGDGGDVAIDPVNPNYVYGEYVDLYTWQATDGGVNYGTGNWNYYGIGDAGSFANFIAPFVMDPNAPTTLLAGGGALWRTTDARDANPNWTSIKDYIAAGQPISAIAVAPGNSNVIWVAYNDGEVGMTTNGTAATPTWTTIDDDGATNPLPDRYATSILIDPANSNVVYITFGGFSSDNVWKTTDGGATWNSISGNLPQAPVHAIARKPSDPNTLYVGTEVGLFSTSNGGATWTSSSDMVANCPVDDLRYMNNSSTLIAGTHGRGVWVLQSQTLSGRVTLANYNGDKTVPSFVVDILDGSNNAVQTFSNVHVDSSGNFSLGTAVSPGTYSVRVKGTTRFLRKRISNVMFTVAGASGLSATLTNGDINGDNTVGLADFGKLKQAYGSTSSSSNWNPSADLDGNGSVGLSDFGILKQNYGKSGDN